MTSAPSPFLAFPAPSTRREPTRASPPTTATRSPSSARSRAGAIVDLSDRGVLSVTGADRLTWLNSLTSQSLTGLAPGESAETLLLDATGRVEYAMRVVDDGETAWLLVDADEPPSARAGSTACASCCGSSSPTARPSSRRSGRSASRTRCCDAVGRGAERRRRSSGATRGARCPRAATSTRRSSEHPGAEWLLERDAGAPRRPRRSRRPRRVPASSPSRACSPPRPCASPPGVPRLATEVDEKTIPHELDWLRTAVHLTKGCYRGQETVAKVHNLGHPPRRLVMLHLDGSEACCRRPATTWCFPQGPTPPRAARPTSSDRSRPAASTTSSVRSRSRSCDAPRRSIATSVFGATASSWRPARRSSCRPRRGAPSAASAPAAARRHAP